MQRRKDRRATAAHDLDEVQPGNFRIFGDGTVREMGAAHA